jgi:hypothetical protein
MAEIFDFRLMAEPGFLFHWFRFVRACRWNFREIFFKINGMKKLYQCAPDLTAEKWCRVLENHGVHW